MLTILLKKNWVCTWPKISWLNRIVRNLETLFTTVWLQSIYKNIIIKSLRSPISIKFFVMQSSSTRVSHKRGSRRYMMHSTSLIGQNAIYRPYCEVNKY